MGKNFSEDGGRTISLSQDVWHSPPFFTSDFQNHASININGSDKILTLTKANEKAQEETIGERSTYWYAGGDVEVAVEYVVTQVCAPNDEKCEVTYYRAELTVSANHRKVKLSGHAVCGD